MYNRYIGNTGEYYRVEDIEDIKPVPPEPEPEPMSPPPDPEPSPEPDSEDSERIFKDVPDDNAETAQAPKKSLFNLGKKDKSMDNNNPKEKKEKKQFDLGQIEHIPSNLRNAIRDILPESIDLGDILLILILLYLFLENEDDEVLIILLILIFMWIKPILLKDDD